MSRRIRRRSDRFDILQLVDSVKTFVTVTFTLLSISLCAVVGLLALVLKKMFCNNSGSEDAAELLNQFDTPDGGITCGSSENDRPLVRTFTPNKTSQPTNSGETTPSEGMSCDKSKDSCCHSEANSAPRGGLDGSGGGLGKPGDGPGGGLGGSGGGTAQGGQRRKKSKEKPVEDLTIYFPPLNCPVCKNKSSLNRSLSKCSGCAKGTPENCPLCANSKQPCTFCKSNKASTIDPCPYVTDDSDLTKPGSVKFKRIKKPCPPKPPCPCKGSDVSVSKQK